MTVRVVAVVPARLDSHRLPCKQLERLGGSTVLGCLIDRLKAAHSVDRVVVATTDRPVDDELQECAHRAGVHVFRHRGDVADVVGRLHSAAREAEANVVVRANADSPLLAPELVDAAVAQLDGFKVDLVTGKSAYTALPAGVLGDVLSMALLAQLDTSLTSLHDREHVTATVFHAGQDVAWMPLDFAADSPGSELLDLTVDTADDLCRVREVVRRLRGDCPAAWRIADVLIAARDAGHPPDLERNSC